MNLKRSWKGLTRPECGWGNFSQNDCQMFHQKIVEIVGQVERSLGENPLTRGTDKTISIAPANCQKELIHQKILFYSIHTRDILFQNNVKRQNSKANKFFTFKNCSMFINYIEVYLVIVDLSQSQNRIKFIAHSCMYKYNNTSQDHTSLKTQL